LVSLCRACCALRWPLQPSFCPLLCSPSSCPPLLCACHYALSMCSGGHSLQRRARRRARRCHVVTVQAAINVIARLSQSSAPSPAISSHHALLGLDRSLHLAPLLTPLTILDRVSRLNLRRLAILNSLAAVCCPHLNI